MKLKVKEKFSRKLIVEGANDQHVLWALCLEYRVPENFDVVDCEGISNLLDTIPIRIKGGFEVIGIVVDADMEFDARWQQIRSRLIPFGYKLSEKPSLNGIILEAEGQPKIGIWMMPDNQSLGKIEDFLQHLVPADDKLLVEAEGVLDSIESQSKNLYAEKDRPKALMHTWLAWQKTPGMPYGLAITAKALTTDVELCQRFMDWLKKLFQ